MIDNKPVLCSPVSVITDKIDDGVWGSGVGIGGKMSPPSGPAMPQSSASEGGDDRGWLKRRDEEAWDETDGRGVNQGGNFRPWRRGGTIPALCEAIDAGDGGSEGEGLFGVSCFPLKNHSATTAKTSMSKGDEGGVNVQRLKSRVDVEGQRGTLIGGDLVIGRGRGRREVER